MHALFRRWRLTRHAVCRSRRLTVAICASRLREGAPRTELAAARVARVRRVALRVGALREHPLRVVAQHRVARRHVPDVRAGGDVPLGRRRPVRPRASRVAAARALVRPLVPPVAAIRSAFREGPALPLDLRRLGVDHAPHVVHHRGAASPVFDPLDAFVAMRAHWVKLEPGLDRLLLVHHTRYNVDVRPPRWRKVLGVLIERALSSHRAPVGHQPVGVDHLSRVVFDIRRVLGVLQPVLG